MDESGTLHERNFALPLFLISLVFFGLYLITIVWILVLVQLSWLGGVLLIFPGGLLLLSLTGAILIVREMKAQSLRWMAGIPLCVLLGVSIAGMVLFISPGSGPIQSYLGIIAVAGFMWLPAGVAYLLRSLKGTEPAAIQSFAAATGIFGCAISGLMLFLVIMTSWMRGLEPVYLVVLFFSLFHILILMPVLGVKMFRLGLRFSKIPAADAGTGGAAEPVLRKKLSEIVRDIPRSMSPRVKRAILVMGVLIVVVAGCIVFWYITDTTPGKTWTKTTLSAPFGSKGGFTIAEYKGKLWLIGGTGALGTNGEAWYTTDGIFWARESTPAMVPSRLGPASAVFKDALWIIGGTTERTSVLNNDVWYSGDGLAWSQIQPAAAFSQRNGHSSVVFRDRLWVIGGNQGIFANNLTNDIWYSDDGIAWQQGTPAAEFSPRSGHSSFVYNDRLWVIGGWNETGQLNDVWSSDDGIHWNEATASAAFARGCPAEAVVFADRMWVIQNFYATDPARPWVMDKSQGIWYSYDGITWTKRLSSPEFFQEDYFGGPPVPVVFGDRLWVLQDHVSSTGVWYTLPAG